MKYRRIAGLAILAMALMIAIPQQGQAEELINCPMTNAGADVISRAFYVPSYPGTTLDQVDLSFAVELPGVYTLSLIAREGAYDGPVIGTVSVTETFSLANPEMNPVTFFFPELSIEPNSIVTFAMQKDAGESSVYYGVHTDEESCPVIQTNGTTPPLDSVRRNGIIVAIHGAGITAEESTSWSMLKSLYR